MSLPETSMDADEIMSVIIEAAENWRDELSNYIIPGSSTEDDGYGSSEAANYQHAYDKLDAALDAFANRGPKRGFTVAGYWADDDTRHVTSVMEGEVQVTGGDNISEGGPFAVYVDAKDADAAEQMVQGSGTDQDFG